MKNFTQLCVWTSTLVGEKTKDFEDFIKKEFKVRAKYACEYKTLKGQGGPGGRNDLLFYVHSDDVSKFAVARLAYGISWWEDFVKNNNKIIPAKIKKEYPKTW